MFNRVLYFIRKNIFHTRLNREKCIHNIEMSNKIKYKNKNNVNMIIKRKMSTYPLTISSNSSNNNNDNNNNDNDNIIFYIFVTAWAVTISSKISKKNKFYIQIYT